MPKLYNEANNDDVSSKSATEVTVMLYNTATLRPAYSLKATVNNEDEIEVHPNQHDDYNRAKLFENTHQEDTQDETYQEDRNRAKNPRDRRNQNTSLALTREQVEDMEKEMFKMIPFATRGRRA